LLAHGRWFSPASSTTKTGRHDIAEILLKVALSTINQIVFVQWCPTNIVLCFCFVFLRLVCPSMLPIFWIILYWLALRYYLTLFPYDTSIIFSGYLHALTSQIHWRHLSEIPTENPKLTFVVRTMKTTTKRTDNFDILSKRTKWIVIKTYMLPFSIQSCRSR
jgi:hypothetical protein